MFYSNTDFLVVREQQRERLQSAARERLIREIQQSNRQRPKQNLMGWISKLLLKHNQSQPNHLDREKAQAI